MVAGKLSFTFVEPKAAEDMGVGAVLHGALDERHQAHHLAVELFGSFEGDSAEGRAQGFYAQRRGPARPAAAALPNTALQR